MRLQDILTMHESPVAGASCTYVSQGLQPLSHDDVGADLHTQPCRDAALVLWLADEQRDGPVVWIIYIDGDKVEVKEIPQVIDVVPFPPTVTPPVWSIHLPPCHFG